jgi:hypothetical protein
MLLVARSLKKWLTRNANIAKKQEHTLPSSSHNREAVVTGEVILWVFSTKYEKSCVVVHSGANSALFLYTTPPPEHDQNLEVREINMSKKNLYKVVFMSQGQVYEIYARSVGHGDMFGFIEVEEIVFGERTTVVVDPAEEKIKAEFEGVKRTYLPMHSIIRIDEVDKKGTSKISKLEGGNVAQFPMPIYTPSDTQK